MHPARLSALLRSAKRPTYPVEHPRAPRLCVHQWSVGGDTKRVGGYVHVQTCKHCGDSRVVEQVCVPENCMTQRRILFGSGYAK